MKINVKIGEKNIKVTKGATFSYLKRVILKVERKLIKYFIFKGQKLNEKLLISDYPEFDIALDPNSFQEYKPGQFRCSSCYKYFKFKKWACSHTAKCKAKHLFGGDFIQIIKCGCDIEVDDSINEIISKIENGRRQNMLNKINEIIGFK